MVLELYLDLISQPSRAVYIFAKKNGIPFELGNVELLKGQHLTKEFFPVNSLQRVPTLKDGDFVLSERCSPSLPPLHTTADHWYPSDLQARVRIHEYLGWHADRIRGTFGVSLWTQVLAPLIGAQVPEEKVKRNRTNIDKALQHLEDKFLGHKAFLTSQQVTLADLMALEELMQVVAVGCPLFEGRPRLAAWREAHGPIFHIVEQAANKTLPAFSEVYPNMLLRIFRIP
uniref:Glutathione transferase n=1 Tax=Rhinolophus ferrumequinum TaxID=59479 RepID=A0A671FFY3_RHIFE